MKTKKLNLKHPKYVLPVLVFPFLLLLGYLTIDMFGAGAEDINYLEITEDINPNLPDPNINPKKKLDKFTAYQDEYKKAKDYSAIQNLDNLYEDEDLKPEESQYTSEEIAEIEANRQKAAEKTREIRELQRKYFGNSTENSTENSTTNRSGPKNKQQDELESFKRQMNLMDSIRQLANPPSSTNEKPVPVASNPKEQEILEAHKIVSPHIHHFNTVVAKSNENFIAAIIDEAQTIINGSRIRVRLMDDIAIGKNVIKQDSYLYGLVSGFSSQRVFVNITSVLLDRNEILNTNLTIYDNDGIKGLYVPNSDFRDLLQQAGGQLSNQQVSMNQQGSAAQQFAYGALQDVYRSVTQAISRNIKQNKAKIKYNSVIYLINEKEQK
jgi:conjugative transposon TraM protein